MAEQTDSLGLDLLDDDFDLLGDFFETLKAKGLDKPAAAKKPRPKVRTGQKPLLAEAPKLAIISDPIPFQLLDIFKEMICTCGVSHKFLSETLVGYKVPVNGNASIYRKVSENNKETAASLRAQKKVIKDVKPEWVLSCPSCTK
jgi:hypothetical protein